MKNITDKTILKQGNKIYQPIKVGDNIIWYESNDFDKHYPRAQSIQYFKDVPVISLDSYVDLFLLKRFPEDGKHDNRGWQAEGWKKCLKESEFQYTQQDIERALSLVFMLSLEEILEQINSISEIEVDDQFNILSYL